MKLPGISVKGKETVLLLVVITVLGLIFRLTYFNHITFGYDQARDIFMAKDIVQGDHLKILGPPTEIFGLNHGPLYWYLLAPIVYLSKGSVFAVKLFIIGLNLITVPIFFYIVKKITNKASIAFLSAFILAVSFDSVQYARWLSNPTPVVLSSLLLFYSFWLLFNKKAEGVYLFLIAWPITVQLEFFFTYFIFYFFLLLVYGGRQFRFKTKPLVISVLLSLLLLSTFVLTEYKYGFRGFLSLVNFLISDKPIHRDFFGQFFALLTNLISTTYLNIGGINFFLSGVLFFGLVIFLLFRLFDHPTRKLAAFILFWIFAPLMLYAFEKIDAHFSVLGTMYGIVFGFSYMLVYYIAKLKEKGVAYTVVALFVIFTGNLLLNLGYNKKGEVLFTVQENMLLNSQTEVIDWVYKEAKGKSFAIDTVTSPLYINTVWAYLFDWYGRQKYGYMPMWQGYPQDGVLGSDIKLGSVKYQIDYGAPENLDGKLLFLIKEPPTGIPHTYYLGYSSYEDTRTRLMEIKKIGDFIVEKRVFVIDRPFSIQNFSKTILP